MSAAPPRVARALAAGLPLLVAIAASAQAPDSTAIPDSLSGVTTVSYVTAQSVYLAAGRSDGVSSASRVLVIRGGRAIAELRVSYLSAHSAACDVLSSETLVNEGDSVRFSPATPSTVAISGGYPRPSSSSALREFGVRGRVGVSYQMVAPLGTTQGSMWQPAFELRADGYGVGGTPVSFSIDARARHTYQAFADGTSNDGSLTRIYQAAISWLDPRDGVRVTLGRQFSNALSPVSLFDGATVELSKARWGAGTFVGSQPAPVTMAFSSQIREYGAYVQLHEMNVPAAAAPFAGASATPPAMLRRWSFTFGGIGSYDGGAINREFVFGQLYYADPRLLVYATQEVDYNRGWKRAAGEPTIVPTSTFATVQWTFSNSVYLHGGFDNRRNVLLYRDYVTPETQFDDSFREGVWGGLSVLPIPLVRVGLDAHASSGGPTGSAMTYTGSVVTSRGLPLEGTVRARATRYTSNSTDGWLFAGAFGVTPLWLLRLELNGGVRDEHAAPGAASFVSPQNFIHWIGLDADLLLAQSWYLLLSVTNTNGGAESSNQVYGSLSYRF